MAQKVKDDDTAGAPPKSALRIHGTIARDLGIDIVSGRYHPNEVLFNEIEASERLNVSRAAYREAIRILAAKGLVESRPKMGTRVKPRSEWRLLDAEVLGWMFQTDPDAELLANLFELRGIFEPEAAALAAQRRTNPQIARMKAALAGMADHTLHDEAGRLADRTFHATILEATGNAFMISLASGITSAISWTSKYKELIGPKRYDADPMPEHERVFDAIVARNPDRARAAMQTLVTRASAEALTARRSRRVSLSRDRTKSSKS